MDWDWIGLEEPLPPDSLCLRLSLPFREAGREIRNRKLRSWKLPNRAPRAESAKIAGEAAESNAQTNQHDKQSR